MASEAVFLPQVLCLVAMEEHIVVSKGSGNL